MTTKLNTATRTLVFAICAALATGPVLAQGHGHGKGHDKAEKKWDKEERKEEKHAEKAHREEIKHGSYFNDQHRVVVSNYYGEHYGGGRACPPGLAKKNNGCLPPGQAKKYVVGQPLHVSYYSVPRPVLVQLPPAPVGYRYVTVNGDILLVAVGTMIVVDALTNLMR